MKTAEALHVNTNNIPILSFFTGAGFLDLGFFQAGFDIVWRNEYNLSFVEGFEYGMLKLTGSEHKVQSRDSIIEVGPNQIARQAFGKSQRPQIFGIIGGPPCPDFSVGGKNRGHEGDNGKLSQVYVDRIVELQPTFFLFENVPGLVRTAKHRLFLDSLKQKLSKDYILDLKVLNALDHGIPQDRQRVFMVGFHRQWFRKQYGKTMTEKCENTIDHWFPWPVDERYQNARTRFPWPQASPFGENPEKPDGIPEELMVGPLICNLEELRNLPNGQEGFNPKSDKLSLIDEGDDSRKSFKRLHRWRYSPTAAYGNNEVHLHPTLPRRLTVREAMRIQTVPDAYALPADMPLSHKFKTIGNGVPVKLANIVAGTFLKVLRGEINGQV